MMMLRCRTARWSAAFGAPKKRRFGLHYATATDRALDRGLQPLAHHVLQPYENEMAMGQSRAGRERRTLYFQGYMTA